MIARLRLALRGTSPALREGIPVPSPHARAGPRVTRSPRRRRVFEEDAYADRAFRSAAESARRARPGVRHADRLRDRAARPDARPRDRDAGPAAGAQARPAGARGAPHRRLPARLHGRRPGARRRGRVGRARASRRARARGRVHERGAAAALRRAFPRCWAACTRRRPPRRRSCTPIPTGWRRRGGASSAPRTPGRSCGARTSRRRPPCARRRARRSWTRSRPTGWQSGYAWPQSRGSQLAGAAVGARAGERVLDLCAAPGGKATQLAAAGAEVVAVEKHPGRARELEENARRLGVRADGRQRGRARASRRPGRVRPGARRRAVLGPRRPQLAPRPPLALRAAARPPARAPAGGDRARAPGRDDHLLGLHRQPRRERGRRRRARPAGRGSRLRVARVPPPAAARSSCSRSRTCTARPGSSWPGCGHKLRAVPWRDWMRTVEVEPSIYAADMAHLGRAGAAPAQRRRAHLPLRRRRRALRRADHDGPGRPARDRARDPRSRRRDRRAPHGLEPRAPLRADEGGRRRQRHVPRRGLRRAVERDQPGALARPRGRRRVQSRDVGARTPSPPRSAPTSCSA